MSANSYTEGQAVRSIVLKSLDGGLTWIPDVTGGASGGGGSVATLTDVLLTALGNGQFLKWDSAQGKWINVTLAGGGDMLASNALSELTATAATARANIGILSAGTHAATDFDVAGAAAAVTLGTLGAGTAATHPATDFTPNPIPAATVTKAMEANAAANSIVGNNTGAPATRLDLTAAQVKALLAIANTDVSGLGTASTQASTAFTPNPIPAATVTNAMQANAAANSMRGNNTGAPAAVVDLTAAQVKALLAIANTDVSGLGTASTQASTAFTANPIPAATVTLAMQALLAANSFMGNNTGVGATPIALTIAQAKSLLAITEADVASLGTDLAAKQSTTLASSHILVGSAGNVATDVAVTGHVAITNAGVTTVRNYVTRIAARTSFL